MFGRVGDLLDLTCRSYGMNWPCWRFWLRRNCVESSKKVQGRDCSEHAGSRKEGTFFASKDVPAGLSKDELGSHRAEAKSYFYSTKPLEMEAWD